VGLCIARLTCISKTDIPDAEDLHTYTGIEPPRRQSARRTRNILPEALQETETAAVPQQERPKRTADVQDVTGRQTVNTGNHSKRPKTAHEGAVKNQNVQDESSELTEPEETSAVMTDSKDDDMSGKSDSPEEEEVCFSYSLLYP
jgi:hypothetical protein